MCLYIYTSGTTGPPKGCLLTHANYREITDATAAETPLEEGDTSYLFLPLAHAFAILIQFATFDLGVKLAYWSRDPAQIIPDLTQTNPSYFPSVPQDVREDLHPGHHATRPTRSSWRRPSQVGLKVRQLQQQGQDVPDELQQGFDQAEEALYKNVRAHLRREHPRVRDRSGADRPGDPRVLLRLRRAGDGGLRHDRDRHRRHGQPLRRLPLRLGRQAAARAWRSRSPTTARCSSRARTSSRATTRTTRPPTRRSRASGCTPATSASIDEDGFLFITGRKKDIIITAGGKNITPANLENGLKQNRWISQAVVVGDRRPYLMALITLDPEELPAFAAGARARGRRRAESEEMKAEVQAVIDEVNSHVGPVEQIKRFQILPADLTQETGELTPTLKVKRNVVHEKYADVIDSVYDRPR